MATVDPSANAAPAGNRAGAIFRALRRTILWSVALTMIFLVFAWLSIPTRLLTWRAVQEAQTRGFQVDIEKLSLSPLGGVSIENLNWHFERTEDYQTTVPFVIDSLDLGVSPMGWLLMDELDADLQADLESGHLESTYRRADKNSKLTLDLSGLPLNKIPRLQQTFNAPLRGEFGLSGELTLVDDRLDKANGVIKIRCQACGLGDGETKLYVPGAKGMLANGFTAPAVEFGNLDGIVRVVDGVATLENVAFDGKDIKIKIDGTIAFKKDMKASRLDLVFKVFVAPELLAREDSMQLLVGSASPKVKLSGAEEGWLGYKLAGSFAHNRFRGYNSKSRADRARDRRESQRRRAEARRKSVRPSTAPRRPNLPLPTNPGASKLPPPGAPPVPGKPPGHRTSAEERIEEARRNIRGDGPRGPGGGAGRTIVPPNQ